MPTTNGLTTEEISDLRVSLREYVDVRLNAMEHHAETVLAGIERNITVADTVLNARLASMNEFRATITDQAGQFITKAEYKAWKEKTDDEIQRLREFRLILDSKASQRSLTFSYVITGIALLISFINFTLQILDRVVATP